MKERERERERESGPGGAGEAGQQQPLGVAVQVHDAGRFEAAPDPVALLQRVDEHELDADVAAVGRLQPRQDLAQRQRRLVRPADERRRRQLEDAVHVLLV